MTKTMYDAAFPPASPPVTDAVLIYIGGDAIHVWSPAQIAAQNARYRLPCWVRSNPGSVAVTGDAGACVAALRAMGAPTGTPVVLDLETAVAPAWVGAFGAILHQAGYLVLPYGSKSSLFANPVLDGYFVASPGAKSIPLNCVAVQYAGNNSYDLDWVADSVPLWDTRPTPPAPPDPPIVYPEDQVETYNPSVEISGGHGWMPSPLPVGQLVGCFALDANPDVTGNYNSDATVPHLVAVASQGGTHSPNGSLNFEGPVDGTYPILLQFTTG